MKCQECLHAKEGTCPYPDMDFAPEDEYECMNYITPEILSKFTECKDCVMEGWCFIHKRNENIIGCQDGRKRDDRQKKI